MKIIKTIIFTLFISIPLLSFANENINLLNKIGYGSTTSSLNNLNELGYEKWIIKQTDPNNQYKDSINSYTFAKTNEELYKSYQNLNVYRKGFEESFKKEGSLDGLLGRNLDRRIDYALNSENRVREMLVYFWYNHFNIGDVSQLTTSIVFLHNYEDMIRENSLGSFKKLLTKVAHSPSMLPYLNNNENQVNEKEGIKELNENYAREFLELHTMGADNGYTQKDVIELAKILSGHSDLWINVSINGKDNRNINSYEQLMTYVKKGYKDRGIVKLNNYYIYRGFSHDKSDKFLLGQKIKSNEDKELDEAIDIIVKRPETAHFISNKLAVYFLNDTPSDKTVEAMSKKFLETDGNISEVLRVLFFSKEFKDNLNRQDKTKDAYTYILSTAKSGLNEETLKKPELIKSLAKFMTMFEANPYQHDNPDGFSIKSSDWKPLGRLNEYIFFTNKILNYYLKDINYQNLSLISSKEIKNKNEAVKYLTSENWLTKWFLEELS